ncbi:MAG: 4-hydroxythreonine-4-phosphate dehydrogenase PdxA [Alphaproteobacteria bacterium]
MTVAPLPLALTMGDPAGIGPELTLAAWRHRAELPPFVAFDDPDNLSRRAALLGLPVPVRAVDTPEEAAGVLPDALPVMVEPLAAPAEPGKPDGAACQAVTNSLRRAVAAARARTVAAVVTNPVHKQSLYEAGFSWPGQTEFLGHLTGVVRPVMMLQATGLRVVPVTVHLALREAIDRLTREDILHAARVTVDDLRRRQAIGRPRLAVAALNPHAGEGGRLGREESEVIAPAVAALRDEGIDVFGPAPADTLFHAEARERYDAAICMYHDQALIPLKTLDFHGGVNVTLGLPIIRTSPDHGVAFDIAGSGRARPDSFFAALRLAARMSAAETGAPLEPGSRSPARAGG